MSVIVRGFGATNVVVAGFGDQLLGVFEDVGLWIQLEGLEVVTTIEGADPGDLHGREPVHALSGARGRMTVEVRGGIPVLMGSSAPATLSGQAPPAIEGDEPPTTMDSKASASEGSGTEPTDAAEGQEPTSTTEGNERGWPIQ